jgi:hypothetical protein
MLPEQHGRKTNAVPLALKQQTTFEAALTKLGEPASRAVSGIAISACVRHAALVCTGALAAQRGLVHDPRRLTRRSRNT